MRRKAPHRLCFQSWTVEPLTDKLPRQPLWFTLLAVGAWLNYRTQIGPCVSEVKLVVVPTPAELTETEKIACPGLAQVANSKST